jgi:hypothetical protein
VLTFAAKRGAGGSAATPYHPLSVLNVAITFHFCNQPGIAFSWCCGLLIFHHFPNVPNFHFIVQLSMKLFFNRYVAGYLLSVSRSL